MYEAYFEKPIIVHDTFYVGGTTHNNLFYGNVDGNTALDKIHQFTEYFGLLNVSTINEGSIPNTTLPNPNYHIMKFFWPYTCQYDPTNFAGVTGFDTSQFYTITPNPWNYNYTSEWEFIEAASFNWNLFFAIIDTNFVPGVGTYDDSCVAPTGLHIEGASNNNIALVWNADGQTLWQYLVVVEGLNPNNGMLQQTSVNYVVLDSLETGHWYTAQVRTFCGPDVYGDWSGPIQFYWGNPDDTITCPTPAGLQVVSTDVGKVVLQWAAGADAVSWETEVGPVGMEPGSGSVAPAPTYFTLRYGLDTATWYWARVRAKCGTDWYSLWSDTVMFYIPGDGSDTTTTINLVEQYTYLMPNPAREEVTVMSSFRIRSVELYGSDGKLLQTKEVNGVGTRLSLEGLPAGVYFVMVRTSAGVTTKRMVIQP